MSWASAIKKTAQPVIQAARAVQYELAQIDWDRLVTLDFETYFDQDYTLKKMSTSEYVRDKRFKAQMVGIKIGRKKTKAVAGESRIMMALKSINWSTQSRPCPSSRRLRYSSPRPKPRGPSGGHLRPPHGTRSGQ